MEGIPIYFKLYKISTIDDPLISYIYKSGLYTKIIIIGSGFMSLVYPSDGVTLS